MGINIIGTILKWKEVKLMKKKINVIISNNKYFNDGISWL